MNLLQHVQAVAVRQADVQQEKIVGMLFELLQAGFAGLRTGDAVALAPQQEFEALANFRFVINHEDGTLRHGPLSSPRGIRRGRRCLCLASNVRQFFRHVP